MPRLLLPLLLLVLLASACQRDTAPAPGGAAQPPATPAPVTAPVVLDDVIERDPRYIVGISYPPVAREHPGLAALLKAYADAARAELDTALDGLGDAKPDSPYDLALGFSEVANTADIVAVAANGSSYTGGAHGNPLVARFVWLPREGRRLTAAALVPDARGWEPIAAYAREQLFTSLSERGERLGDDGGMIDAGTAPDPANYDQFEPVLAADGRIRALRFVFPPYQVGPYAAGVQTVEVPAAVLLPVIAEEYRALFEGG